MSNQNRCRKILSQSNPVSGALGDVQLLQVVLMNRDRLGGWFVYEIGVNL